MYVGGGAPAPRPVPASPQPEPGGSCWSWCWSRQQPPTRVPSRPLRWLAAAAVAQKQPQQWKLHLSSQNKMLESWSNQQIPVGVPRTGGWRLDREGGLLAPGLLEGPWLGAGLGSGHLDSTSRDCRGDSSGAHALSTQCVRDAVPSVYIRVIH